MQTATQNSTQTDITYSYATRPMPGVFSRDELIERLEAGAASPVKYAMEDVESLSAQWVD